MPGPCPRGGRAGQARREGSSPPEQGETPTDVARMGRPGSWPVCGVMAPRWSTDDRRRRPTALFSKLLVSSPNRQPRRVFAGQAATGSAIQPPRCRGLRVALAPPTPVTMTWANALVICVFRCGAGAPSTHLSAPISALPTSGPGSYQTSWPRLLVGSIERAAGLSVTVFVEGSALGVEVIEAWERNRTCGSHAASSSSSAGHVWTPRWMSGARPDRWRR